MMCIWFDNIGAKIATTFNKLVHAKHKISQTLNEIHEIRST